MKYFCDRGGIEYKSARREIVVILCCTKNSYADAGEGGASKKSLTKGFFYIYNI